MPYKIAIGLAIFLASHFSFSQAYKPILSDSCTWYFTSHYFGFSSDSYFVSKDTVIGNKAYKILDGFHFNSNAFLREDTLNRKVYYRQTKGFRANQDILIYDFSLLVGDSMMLYNPNTAAMDSVGYFTLDSIVNRVIKSGSARMFFLSGPKDNSGLKQRAEWIEGVGSTFMINSGGTVGDLYNQGELTCFFQNDQHTYESELSAEFGSCVINNVGIEKNEGEDMLSVYPNPVVDRIHIQSGNELRQLQVYSLHGELVLDKVLNNKREVIDVSNLKTGSYVAIVIDNKFNRSKAVFLKN